jgi:molybdenum cofactor biosynthesis enzyme MoaA
MNINRMYFIPTFAGKRMVEIYFEGCNFECIGCVRKRARYLPPDKVEYMSFDSESILKKIQALQPHWIVLGGYEPTTDPDLNSFVERVSRLQLHSWIRLETNGSQIDIRRARELKKAGVSEVYLSVYAFDSAKHLYYTKRNNREVFQAIESIKEIEDYGFRLTVSPLLIPGVNDPNDIEKLAKFISEIDPTTPLHIMPWIPVPSVKEIREPTKETVLEAFSKARQYLHIVSEHPLASELELITKKKPWRGRANTIEFLPESSFNI